MLSELLNLGKKDPAKEPPVPSSTDESFFAAPAAAPAPAPATAPAGSAPVMNAQELRYLNEVLQKQSEHFEEQHLKEEEAQQANKRHLDEAAEQVAEMAKKRRATLDKRKATRYTAMCIHFSQGNCRKGMECTFAHGESELAPRSYIIPDSDAWSGWGAFGSDFGGGCGKGCGGSDWSGGWGKDGGFGKCGKGGCGSDWSGDWGKDGSFGKGGKGGCGSDDWSGDWGKGGSFGKAGGDIDWSGGEWGGGWGDDWSGNSSDDWSSLDSGSAKGKGKGKSIWW